MKAHVSSAIKVRLIQGASCVLLLLPVCVTPFALGLLQSDVRFQNQNTDSNAQIYTDSAASPYPGAAPVTSLYENETHYSIRSP